MASLKGNQRDAVFAGELVVFTGKLSTVGRKEAHALVEQFGGQAAEEVTAKTTILIVGSESGLRDTPDRAETEKTHKLKKAEQLNLRTSARIRILSESEFCKLVGLTAPDTLRQQVPTRFATFSGCTRNFARITGDICRNGESSCRSFARALMRTSNSPISPCSARLRPGLLKGCRFGPC